MQGDLPKFTLHEQAIADIGRKLASRIDRALRDHIDLFDDPKDRFVVATYALAQMAGAIGGLYANAFGTSDITDEQAVRGALDAVFGSDRSPSPTEGDGNG
jgi:hypothetical protein